MNESSTAKRRRVTWSTEERIDWVRMFEKSGKAVSETCSEVDLPEATLSLWRKQLRGPESGGEAGVLGLTRETRVFLKTGVTDLRSP